MRGFLAFGGPPRRHGWMQLEKLVSLDPGRGPGVDFEAALSAPKVTLAKAHSYVPPREGVGEDFSESEEASAYGHRSGLGGRPRATKTPAAAGLPPACPLRPAPPHVFGLRSRREDMFSDLLRIACN